MVERGATLQEFDRGATGAMWGPLAGLGAQALLLAALAQTVGLGRAGWVVGVACGLILNGALARALWRDPTARLGPAGWVTLARATLAVGVAALTADSFPEDTATTVLVTLASIALVLDFVDGRVARRTGTASKLGARMDGEVDAFLILALSVEVARSAGPWVLAIGAARYVFLAAGWLVSWMRAPLPRRDWRKVVAATQGIALTIAAAGILSPAATRVGLLVALALLAESFGRDVWWLWRHRSAAPRRVARRPVHPAATATITILAVLVVWVALVAPNRPWLLTPSAFARVPLEGIVVVALAVVLPGRVGRVMPWVLGPVLALFVLAKLLDIGFFIAFDRPFNPVDDWSYAPLGVETVGDTYGRTAAHLVVVGITLIVVAALVLSTLAVVLLTRAAVRHRRSSLQGAAVLGCIWVLCWASGAELVSGTSIASATAANQAADELRLVQTDLDDRARFNAVLAGHDSYSDTPVDRLLTGLRGKDVLLVFVESYGRIALEGTSFSSSINAVLDEGTRQLDDSGFSSRSGWLTSSVFGGGSWLAHATLQSGVRTSSPDRYAELVASNRFTLSKAFRRSGWRTVADDPSNSRAWPEGTSFYRYDKIYDRRNVGYRGPRYAFASMPDQYAFLALQRLELAKPKRRPVFAEVDTVSSHHPWTRIPPLIDWNRVGDGAIFNGLPIDETGSSNVRQGYAHSITYALRTLFSFVEHYGRKNLVLVVVGDHQPSHIVTGYQPGHDVPISIIAHDPAVMQQIAGWGWVDGMRPDATAPIWPMSAFRNRFLDAFDS